ncbi:MAG: hypothetical protein LAN84_02955 [Acidobacteriia bacterium]|nr:hypothetical protein [Terriglobia bacterium]
MSRRHSPIASRFPLRIPAGFAFCGLLLCPAAPVGAAWHTAQQPPAAQDTPSPAQSEAPSLPATLPRGKRLILKDGNFHIVRSYQRNGDRVRYYSIERSAWEELPAALVDWEATAKAETEQARAAEILAKKVHSEEEASRTELALDVDASLQVAPGLFLPPGEGMFVVEGRVVTPLEQVGTELHRDKKQFLKQVLVPIPIVPDKRNLEIPGSKARLRFTSATIEFYLREAPPDPERASPVRKSSRPGESGPEVELIRATVKGSKRQVESIRSFFGQQVDTRRDTIPLQRWDTAPTVFRFTLSQPLPPGEYVLAEFLPEGMNLYVWDFAVDAAPGQPSGPGKAATPRNPRN